MSIYDQLPILMQNVAASVHGWNLKRSRYGRYFWEQLKKYEERAQWDAGKLAEYRDCQLRAIVEHSYSTVPYYRKVFDEGGINPSSIRGLEDLSRLPILTKSIVNKNPEAFLSTEYAGKKIRHHTSGTTGSGFVFYVTPESVSQQWACWWRFRRSLGISLKTPQATFGTQKIVPTNQKKPPYWRVNIVGKQTYFSAFHENEQNLASYCKKIKTSRIPWIHGYPSLISPLAAYAIEHGINFENIKFITIGAENLLEKQRENIKEAFGVYPFQHYGMCEGVANFSEDINHRMFVDEDYAAVEFIGLQDGSSRSQIIGTTLTNYAMPLLRWSIGDVGEVKTLSDGRREIVSLDGRIEDSVILPDGTRIGKLDHVFKDTTHITEAQIYQHKDYSITIYAIKNKDDVSEDEQIAFNELEKSLRIKIPIKFKYVDSLPRSSSGKLRFVVSELDNN